MSDTTDTDTPTTDPSRIVPPPLDTRLHVWIIPAQELLYLAPAVISLLLAWVGLAADASLLMWGGAVSAVLFGLGGLGLILGTHEFTTPADSVRSLAMQVTVPRALPLSHDGASAEPIHGTQRIYEDGSALMADGRVVGLARIEGRNTDLQSDATADRLASALADGIDEDLRDVSFRYYSTTTAPDTEALVGRYQEQAFSETFGGDEWASAREVLHDITEWLEGADGPRWGAQDWHHYIAIAVRPDETDQPPRERATQSRAQRLLSRVRADDEADVERRRGQQRAALKSRLTTVETNVIGNVPGCDAERVGPAEHAALLARYWSGTDHGLGDRPADALPDDAMLGEAATPDTYDISDGHVRVGDHYCRTFWLADWPIDPEAGFLRDLYTMRDIDLDVTIHANAVAKQPAIEELKHDIASTDASLLEREDDTDISSLAADDRLQALIRMYDLLRQTPAQPWDVTGYVTVRAGTREALAHAEAELGGEVSTVDIAKREALEDAADRVRDVLERTPADLLALSPGIKQGQLFEAGSPTGRDVYDEQSTRDRTVRTLGGTLGGVFPFGTTTVRDSAGVEYGRHLQTGSLLVADPFARGGAPHQLTIAKSGSGKTYSVGKRSLRWWLADPDRTLVLCDTMGGFAGLTDVTNGEHIVVDGERTINPLALSADDGQVASDIDPYRMKIDEAREFIAGVLRGQGVDPGPFVATIEAGLDATYREAGIYPDDPESHGRDSPTIADFIDTLGDMLENPGEYTHTGHPKEMDQRMDQVSRLLDKLSGFRDGGKYRHLVGESDVTIQPGQVTYLDLQQIEGQGAAEKSTMLQLMLSMVYQTVKQAPEETLFVIDEAHYLLHSPGMVEWLQQAARHWRHYQASLHFVSQSPAEFVGGGDGETADHRETITGQCSTIEFYQTPGLSDDVADKFGLNEQQRQFVRSGATPGSAGLGYSQGLLSLSDYEGWFRVQVAAAPAEDAILTEGGDGTT